MRGVDIMIVGLFMLCADYSFGILHSREDYLMLRKIFFRLWNDESGAVIATEYLLLGSIVSLGSASGMVAMRDSVVDEYKELGQGVRDIRHTKSQPASGGTARNGSPPSVTANGLPPVLSAQDIRFSCPTP